MSSDNSPSHSHDAEFEEWLSKHPETEGELADLQNLRELYQSVSQPEPDETSWQATQTRIHEAASAVVEVRRRAPRPFWFLFGATAAAAILAFLLTRSLWMPTLTPGPLAEEELPVAEDKDISIVSMEARDVVFLVVGQPPISGPLEFAKPEDIQVIHCERCPFSGEKAQWEPQGEVPMFVSTTGKIIQADD
jgi:hypothetical protein